MTSRGPSVTWVLEAEVFPSSHEAMRSAILEAGHEVVLWQDDWWVTARWPRLPERSVVFHGSLGNAARIRRQLPWTPGAYCDTDAFLCTSWYPTAARWLLHRQWQVSSVAAFVEDPDRILDELDDRDGVFVRPNSPLKPFTGRVLQRDAISLKALDHGYYYDDASLPIIVAPARAVSHEWRYVVVEGRVIAGGAYAPGGRASRPDDPAGPSWRFAESVASELRAPEDVYVMDVCEADRKLHLLELNPFSGADLYACRRREVVEGISALAIRSPR